jgi:hypothetical protein
VRPCSMRFHRCHLVLYECKMWHIKFAPNFYHPVCSVSSDVNKFERKYEALWITILLFPTPRNDNESSCIFFKSSSLSSLLPLTVQR